MALQHAFTHAFTVDVEDWFQGIPISSKARESAENRLERGMDRLCALLDDTQTKATFFFLGPVAQQYPHLVKRLSDQGHEIGCHGWSHDLLYDLSRERLLEETKRARDVIADQTGKPVTAYRAAYFSIIKKNLWALEVLAELGFRYDSSIFPVQNWRYGIPDFDLTPKEISTPSGPIYEVPLSVRTVMGKRVPVSGGAYFRIFPYPLTKNNFRSLEKQGRPVVFYLHPWELDADHPKVNFYWKARLTHYFNLESTERKLRSLLRDFRFGTLGEVIENGLN